MHTKFLLGNPEELVLLRRPRRRWEENIKMNFKIMLRCGLGISGLESDLVAGCCEHCN
jgi:hypothetical protein